MFGVPLSLIAVSYQYGFNIGVSSEQASRISERELDASRKAMSLADMSSEVEAKLASITRRLASLQAHVTRLDALGAHLTDMAGLEAGEFDFSLNPAVGGPEQPVFAFRSSDSAYSLDRINELDAMLLRREAQFEVLAGLLSVENLRSESTPIGRPIRSGWQSSRFGPRIDPISGRHARHEGIDFAGKEGSEILAVASGIVSWSGKRGGYGSLVEIAHGDNVVTRYAHNRENLVEVGDLVRRGETIALMGSTGRSTGPHVHFEIYKNGRAIDPAIYVRQNTR